MKQTLHFIRGTFLLWVFLSVVEGKKVLLEDLEVAPYKVLRSEQGYELRKFEGGKWACHDLVKAEKLVSVLMETQFYSLWKFRAGDNDRKVKIPVTAPTSVKMTETPDGKFKSQQCLYIPMKFQKNVPKPTDNEVYIEDRPAMTAFTRRISGFITTRLGWEYEAEILKKDLEAFGEQADFSFFYTASYNAETLDNKRWNEVWYLQK